MELEFSLWMGQCYKSIKPQNNFGIFLKEKLSDLYKMCKFQTFFSHVYRFYVKSILGIVEVQKVPF